MALALQPKKRIFALANWLKRLSPRLFTGSVSGKLRKLIVINRIRRIKSRDFSIIASNCTGTLPYRFLDMPYTTPTINLYFMAPDYLRFIKRLPYYLSLPLGFIDHSRFDEAERVRQQSGFYPIGLLGDIEIHFMHYKDRVEAAAKWNRRKKRINPDKLIFAFTDKDLCTPDMLREFDSLPFANKFVFTANRHPDIQHSIQVSHYQGQSEMGDAYTNYDTLVHVDFAQLIDSAKYTLDRPDTTASTQALPTAVREHASRIKADAPQTSSII